MKTSPNWSRLTRPCVLFVVIAVTVGSLLGGAQRASAQIEQEEQLRLLTAVGNSKVRVRPDLAEVRLGVETEAPTASEARQENALRAARVVDALKALGIPEQAIETSIFQIVPVRRFEEPQQRGLPPIVGYRVSNIISVRTEKLDLVPQIIDESVGAGANRVDSVNFRLRDEAAPRQTALKQAVANARENARAMAGELKVQLVRVHRVEQGGVGVVPPPILFRGVGAEAAAPTPIFPGEATVSASVTLTYLIR